MKIKMWFGALLALFLSLNVFGQDPVKWKTSVEYIDGTNQAYLVYKATIDDGWHLYSQFPENAMEGPLPTTFGYSDKSNFKLLGKAKEYGVHDRMDDMFGIVVHEFEKKGKFKQKIEITSNEEFYVPVTIDYMSCNNTQCVPLKSEVTFKVKIPENASSTATTETTSNGEDANENANETDTEDEFDINDEVTFDYGLAEVEKNKFELTISPTFGDGVTVNSSDISLEAKNVEGLTIGEFNRKRFENGSIQFKSIINKSTSEEPILPVKISYLAKKGGKEYNGEQEILANFSTSSLLTSETCEKKVFDANAEISFSYWELMIEAFILGLISLLTPCVFPMIPMTVTYFMKGNKSKAKGRSHAVLYGLFIIGIYTLIGTVVALIFGAAFANWLATNWIPNVIFFLVFMVFAASFLGMFEIKLPSKLVNKSDAAADRGGLAGIFFMALTLVLVSFSCTGPVVGIILIKASQGDVIEPMLGMFAFSLAFALPFALFAFFPSLLKNLPKSGGWLNAVKVVLGLAEIALGLKFLSVADQTYHWEILDREVYIAIWIVVFAIMGLYLLGKIKFSHDSDMPYLKVPRLFLAIGVFSFVVYLIPGMWGAPLKSLAGYLPPMSSHDFDIVGSLQESDETPCGDAPKYVDKAHLELPHGIGGYFEINQAIECSKEIDKPIFIDFTGHGCVNCREMEAKVWSDDAVLKMLKEDFVVVALYCDDKTELPEEEWVKSKIDGRMKKTIGEINLDYQQCNFGNVAQPLYVIMDANGKLLANPRAHDTDVEAYTEWLKKSLELYKNRKAVSESKTLKKETSEKH